jgi:hypothetical protein
MRTVKIFKYEKRELKDAAHPFGETYHEKVEQGTGLFHGWGSNYEEFENGHGNFSAAIVEMPDGSVQQPPADMVQFLSSPNVAGETPRP